MTDSKTVRKLTRLQTSCILIATHSAYKWSASGPVSWNPPRESHSRFSLARLQYRCISGPSNCWACLSDSGWEDPMNEKHSGKKSMEQPADVELWGKMSQSKQYEVKFLIIQYNETIINLFPLLFGMWNGRCFRLGIQRDQTTILPPLRGACMFDS